MRHSYSIIYVTVTLYTLISMHTDSQYDRTETDGSCQPGTNVIIKIQIDSINIIGVIKSQDENGLYEIATSEGTIKGLYSRIYYLEQFFPRDR